MISIYHKRSFDNYLVKIIYDTGVLTLSKYLKIFFEKLDLNACFRRNMREEK